MVTTVNRPLPHNFPDSAVDVFFQQAPEPYIVTDGEGVIEALNDAAGEFLNPYAGRLEGRALTSLIVPEHRRRLRRRLARLEPGQTTHVLVDLRLADGSTLPCRASATVVECLDGTTEILWLLTDTSELKNAEIAARTSGATSIGLLAERTAQLERAIAELRVASAHKEEFLALMSHELRTPLTVLLGGTRLLHSRIENVASEDRRELLADMLEHGQRLQELIENLMVLARHDSIPVEPIDLSELVTRVVYDQRATDPAFNVRLTLPDDLPDVKGSTISVVHVLRNVLSNARKYTRPIQPIEIRARRIRRHVIVSVRDRGPGIEPTSLKQVFETFYRNERVHAREPSAGVGLSAAQKLMEAQHGRIWALLPRDGEGCMFNIALPVALPNQVDESVGART